MEKGCKKCGRMLSASAKFCRYCGMSVPQKPTVKVPNFCRRCGSPLKPGQKFCIKCGYSLQTAMSQNTAAQQDRVPPQHAASQQRADTPREIKRKKNPLPAVIAVVLVVTLVFTALVKPGFLLKKPGNASGDYSITVSEGNSRAFSIRPIKGMTISAEKNAFDKDRAFDVHELDPSDAMVVALDEAFREGGGYLFGAYEMDAGLGDDGRIPGYYKVEMNLKELGVDKSLYDKLAVFRIDNRGNVEEYSTNVYGDILTYESNQNCLITLGTVTLGTAVKIAALAGSSYVFYKMAEAGYNSLEAGKYYMSQSQTPPSSYQGSYNNHDFEIIWSPDDVTARVNRLIKKTEEETRTAVESELSISSYADKSEYNKAVAAEVFSRLRDNEKYQDYQNRLETPKSIETLQTLIYRSYQYLGELGAKLPGYCVKFYLVGSSALDHAQGQASTTDYLGMSFYYILLNVDTMTAKRDDEFIKKTQDDMLLTIVHELFHLCQKEYGTDNIKVDEATAVLLEKDAYKYFKDKEIVDKVDDECFTPTDYYEDLIIGIDESADNLLEQHEGYVLSLFLQYLRDETKKDVNAVKVKADYAGNFTAVLKKCFGVNDQKLSEYYRKFCQKYKDDFLQRYLAKGKKNEEGTFSKPVSIPTSGEATVSIQARQYANTVREIMRPEQRSCAVIVTTKDVPANFSVIPIQPKETVSNYNYEGTKVSLKPEELEKGCFYPNGAGSVYLLEVYGGETSGRGEYDIDMVCAPEAPKVETKDGYMYVKLPEKSATLRTGKMEGYCLFIQASDGELTLKQIPAGKTDDVVKIRLSQLVSEYTDKKSLSSITFSVSLAEYVTAKNGNTEYGPESETAGADFASDSGELVWVLEEFIFDSPRGWEKQFDPESLTAHGRLDRAEFERQENEAKAEAAKRGGLYLRGVQGEMPRFYDYTVKIPNLVENLDDFVFTLAAESVDGNDASGTRLVISVNGLIHGLYSAPYLFVTADKKDTYVRGSGRLYPAEIMKGKNASSVKEGDRLYLWASCEDDFGLVYRLVKASDAAKVTVNVSHVEDYKNTDFTEYSVRDYIAWISDKNGTPFNTK